jgi:hypothetical protein
MDSGKIPMVIMDSADSKLRAEVRKIESRGSVWENFTVIGIAFSEPLNSSEVPVGGQR